MIEFQVDYADLLLVGTITQNANIQGDDDCMADSCAASRLSEDDPHRLVALTRVNSSDLDQLIIIERLCTADGWTADNFLEEFDRSFSIKLGLRQAENLLAYVFFWLIAPEAFLMKLNVHPRRQGCGLGKRLLGDAIEFSKRAKATQMHLEVRIGNTPAQKLYEKFGFVTTNIRENYYSQGRHAALMTLNLDSKIQSSDLCGSS
ncbi:MAG: ribosomal protein S18-alanine N-acetyltransferase [Deltaproteobacteria bacterium]|jgi:ribosomal-protein-alanine N-acetyltransferase|nr:ribosomal protein S18-alanine N-acetyltransferase [Deltaproteobacteria bacterium]